LAPTDTSKWVVLTKLAQARFLNNKDVLNAMHLTAWLTGQQPTGIAVFVAAKEVAMAAEEVKALARASADVSVRLNSRSAEEEAWAYAAAMVAKRRKWCWRWRQMRRARPSL
jgi:hypothetical protein